MARIIAVDDEPSLLHSLERFLTARGHTVSTAPDGILALDVLRQGDKFELMLLDVKLPGMTGIDVVPEALAIDPDLAIVMMSGMDDATSAALCLQRGALDYLTKPLELAELSSALDRALRRRDSLMRSHEVAGWMRKELEERDRLVQESQQKLHEVTVATLSALVNALEAKDPYLQGHSARVASLSATIANTMRLPDDEVERVREAGWLHDLGKIGIRESVLQKKGPLTPEEYEHVKQHVMIGSQILAPITHLGPIIDYVRSHHERWDGNGYPDGLSGTAIPIGARIIGAVELYDALTSTRSYQSARTPAEATEKMKLLVGTFLDPDVAAALARVVAQRQALIFINEP